jgi:uncharacterized OB-fold protein
MAESSAMETINDTLSVERDPPNWRSFSQPFWDATREKKVLIQYDREAKKYQFFPRATSIYTGRKSNLEWREVSGRGEVYSFTIVRRARPSFQGHEPFFIAIVKLLEDVTVMANMVNCPVERMQIGLKVKPYWSPLSNETHLLMFEPE